MPGSRRLSQRISEGDGIAIVVRVDDVDGARAAEAQGAKALAVSRVIDGIRGATTLPILWLGNGAAVEADAYCVRFDGDLDQHELEPVVAVYDEEEIPVALELHDPEIFLLGSQPDDDEPLESVLDMLPDVPAGKLAIAAVDVTSRDEVVALERAGIDAVLVPAGHVGELVGAVLPDV